MVSWINLLPRHPDRVTQQKLPTGSVRYKLADVGGPRYVTQDEMFVLRDLSTYSGSDLHHVPDDAWRERARQRALAISKAAGTFFKTGMTASLAVTYNSDVNNTEEGPVAEVDRAIW